MTHEQRKATLELYGKVVPDPYSVRTYSNRPTIVVWLFNCVGRTSYNGSGKDIEQATENLYNTTHEMLWNHVDQVEKLSKIP